MVDCRGKRGPGGGSAAFSARPPPLPVHSRRIYGGSSPALAERASSGVSIVHSRVDREDHDDVDAGRDEEPTWGEARMSRMEIRGAGVLYSENSEQRSSTMRTCADARAAGAQ